MSFFEVQFPTTISYRAIGGPGFLTTVNKGFSGQEQRNKNRVFSRGQWTVSLLTPASVDNPAIAGPSSRQEFIDVLTAFFMAVSGRGDSFRLKDHKDFKFTASPIGTGDGTTTAFQLVKNYSIGGRTYTRKIYKPITAAVNDYLGNPLADTVTLYDNGSPVSGTANATTGIATYASAPASGHALTASGQFHFPVRFDTDQLQMQIEESDVAGGNANISVNSITLIETLAPNF